MSKSSDLDLNELFLQVKRDLADSYDEELEMEFEDHHPLPGTPEVEDAKAEKEYRRQYFSQLLRLQADDASQLTSLTYQKASTTLGNLTYTYDPLGRRSSMGGSFAQIESTCGN